MHTNYHFSKEAAVAIDPEGKRQINYDGIAVGIFEMLKSLPEADGETGALLDMFFAGCGFAKGGSDSRQAVSTVMDLNFPASDPDIHVSFLHQPGKRQAMFFLGWMTRALVLGEGADPLTMIDPYEQGRYRDIFTTIQDQLRGKAGYFSAGLIWLMSEVQENPEGDFAHSEQLNAMLTTLRKFGWDL